MSEAQLNPQLLLTLTALRDSAPASALAFEWVGQDYTKWKRVKLDVQGCVNEL